MISNNPSNLGQLAESTSDDEARLNMQGAPPAVTRISRRALLLTGVFGASLGLIVLMVGFGDHSPPRKEGTAEENSIRPSGPIESVKDLPQDYSFDAWAQSPRIPNGSCFSAERGLTDCSSTRTDMPARRNSAAKNKPSGPAPAMTTSYTIVKFSKGLRG